MMYRAMSIGRLFTRQPLRLSIIAALLTVLLIAPSTVQKASAQAGYAQVWGVKCRTRLTAQIWES